LPLINHEVPVRANPTQHTWTVDDNGPANFTKIQDAINNASSGDTVFVHTGIYHENVVINKTITLVGEDSNSTIIDGNETGDVIHIIANDVTVKGFTVTKSGMYIYCGILVDHSIGNAIINNNILYNYKGVSLVDSSNNVVYDNTILSNYDGVYLYYSSNNAISGNMISLSNYNGVYLYYSSNNAISGNVILHNHLTGISLYYSSNTVVCDNSVLNNYHGIYLAFSSDDNTIYHNNFNNTYQVWTESRNFWNYDDEGNYWSNYAGQDLNEDGIGDTTYYINAANEDNNPLMGIFSEFSIALEGETYSINVISNSTTSFFSFQIGAETGNKMICFNTTGENGTVGFSRVKIPTKLMNYPYIVVVGSEEITPKLLNVSNEAYAYLYFTYLHKNRARSITIISSKTLALYFELLDEYLKLQKDLYDLNETYYTLLANYSILLGNYTQLQISFGELNNSYLEHLVNYFALLGNYNILLYNYTQLQISFHDLNDSYLKHLLDYSEQMQNIRNLTYIFVALAAILIVTTVYLSKRAHTNLTTRTIEGK